MQEHQPTSSLNPQVLRTSSISVSNTSLGHYLHQTCTTSASLSSQQSLRSRCTDSTLSTAKSVTPCKRVCAIITQIPAFKGLNSCTTCQASPLIAAAQLIGVSVGSGGDTCYDPSRDQLTALQQQVKPLLHCHCTSLTAPPLTAPPSRNRSRHWKPGCNRSRLQQLGSARW